MLRIAGITLDFHGTTAIAGQSRPQSTLQSIWPRILRNCSAREAHGYSTAQHSKQMQILCQGRQATCVCLCVWLVPKAAYASFACSQRLLRQRLILAQPADNINNTQSKKFRLIKLATNFCMFCLSLIMGLCG